MRSRSWASTLALFLAACPPPGASGPPPPSAPDAGAAAAAAAPPPMPERFGFGAPAPAQLIAAWDIDVLPDGTGLPPGGGTAEQGRGVYQTHCAACHGAPAAGGPGMWQKFLGTKVPLTGKIGTITSTRPVRTVTSYWPYAPSLFDYIRRAMPMATPGALTDDEVYAVTAYLLAEDGLVEKKQRVDRQVLSGIQMPNRDGFVRQPLP